MTSGPEPLLIVHALNGVFSGRDGVRRCFICVLHVTHYFITFFSCAYRDTTYLYGDYCPELSRRLNKKKKKKHSSLKLFLSARNLSKLLSVNFCRNGILKSNEVQIPICNVNYSFWIHFPLSQETKFFLFRICSKLQLRKQK